MAASELGKLAELDRANSLTPRDSVYALISSFSIYLLERDMIPQSLGEIEGKVGQPPEADTLANISNRLEATGYQKGAIGIKHLNEFFNETGIFTDGKQKELVEKAKSDSK